MSGPETTIHLVIYYSPEVVFIVIIKE